MLSVVALALVANGVGGQTQAPAFARLDGRTLEASQIDRTVTALLKAGRVTGAGIALFQDGKIAYLQAYGYRNKEIRLPLQVNSVLPAASFSKVALAYLALELVDRGMLDLDRPVYQYLSEPLPDEPDYSDLAGDPRYQLLTARMLLDHTSGFPNWRAYEEDRRLRIHFPPGSRFAYSGEGIDLLAFVMETITKQPLEELMQRNVFEPLGMTRTSMVWQERFDGDVAYGYDENGRSLGYRKRSQADAAGSMQTTVSDFARFLEALLGGKGLSPKTYGEMLRRQIPIYTKHEFPTLSLETTDENKALGLGYGLGVGLFWTPYGKVFFKEGHDRGTRNYFACFAERKTGLLIMTNSENGEGIFKDLLETLLGDTFTPLEWEGYTPYDQLPRSPEQTGRAPVPLRP